MTTTRSRCRVQCAERSAYHIGAAGMEPSKSPIERSGG
jgi:hypothetical protein